MRDEKRGHEKRGQAPNSRKVCLSPLFLSSPLSAIAALVLFAALPGFAQELEPRAYRTLPTGLNFFVLGYSFSSGNVVADATSPLQDLSADVHTTSLGYLRSFGILGRSASVTVFVPYVYMSASARLEGELVSGSRTGTADARLRLAVNLLGGPALEPEEFAQYRQKRNLGVGLTITPPTGQYASTHLINFGSNRWGFKPEIGYSSIRGRWIFELTAGAWVFTPNNDYFGGTRREQDPIGSLQAHASYNFGSGIWLALDANYFTGGQTRIDGERETDLQRSSRAGLTLSLPLGGPHSLKLAAHTGAFTRIGADFDVASVAYQFRW